MSSRFKLLIATIVIIFLGGLVFLGLRVFEAKAQTFKDVPVGNAFYYPIEAITKAGITAGCAPGNYCPDQQVTRAQMAVYLVRAMKIGLINPDTPTFADVPKTVSYYPYVEAIYKAGITAGCNVNPTRYCPDDKVTKAQTAVYLQRALKLTLINPDTPTFSDIPKSASYYQHVETINKQGIIAGCLPQKYCPDEIITRGSMALYLVRAFKIPYGEGKIQGNVLYDTSGTANNFEKNKFATKILDQNQNLLATSGSNGYTTNLLQADNYTLSGQYQDWKPENSPKVLVSFPFDFRQDYSNLIYNSGFEGQPYGSQPSWGRASIELGVWNLYSASGVTSSANGAKYAGSWGLKVENSSSSGISCASQIVFAQGNSSYTLSAYAKKLSGASQTLYLRFLDTSRAPIGDATATFNLTAWQQKKIVSNSPQNTAFIQVIIYDSGVSSFYWDDIYLQRTLANNTLIFKADDLKMGRKATVQGYIKDDDDNYVANASVTIKKAIDSGGSWQEGDTIATVNTDENGYYTAEIGMPAKNGTKVTVIPQKDKYTFKKEQIYGYIEDDIPSPNQSYWLADRILLQNVGAVEGHVTFTNGSPIEGVSIWSANDYTFEDNERIASTDSSGYYKIERLEVGSVKLKFELADYYPKEGTVTTKVGETVTLNMSFNNSTGSVDIDTRPGVVSGTATDQNNNPMGGLTIVLSNGGTYSTGDENSYQEQKYVKVTAADGTVNFNDIPTGTYSVMCFKDNNDGTTTYYQLNNSENGVFVEHGMTAYVDLSMLTIIQPSATSQ